MTTYYYIDNNPKHPESVEILWNLEHNKHVVADVGTIHETSFGELWYNHPKLNHIKELSVTPEEARIVYLKKICK